MLTFDDGPADHATDAAILRVLAKHRAHAIFFTICGKTEQKGRAIAGRVQDLRADVAAGHLIGNHTYTHPQLTRISQTELVHQIAGRRTTLRRITGQQIHWFRPPWGRSNSAVTALVKQAGMQQMLWLDNSEDTLRRTPSEIRHRSTMMASNGGILLMHSLSTTAAALDDTLTALERKGYRFVLPITLVAEDPIGGGPGAAPSRPDRHRNLP